MEYYNERSLLMILIAHLFHALYFTLKSTKVIKQILEVKP